MPKPLELTGRVFGRLTVLGRSTVRIPMSGLRAREHGWTLLTWECRCKCGNIVNVPTGRLTRETPPNTRSCGCLQRDKAKMTGKNCSSHLHVIPKICAYYACRKEFLGTSRQKYHSRECKEEADLAKRDGRCEICGKPVPGYRQLGAPKFYCSQKCKRQMQQRRQLEIEAAALTAELNRRLTHDQEK